MIIIRDKTRIKDILSKLEKIWNDVPDYRFFQMLNAIGFDSRYDFFYLEDSEIQERLNQILENSGDTH